MVGISRALEILKSASKYGKNVKAIAVTGSMNAISTGQDVRTRAYNSDEWLPVRLPLHSSTDRTQLTIPIVDDSRRRQSPK